MYVHMYEHMYEHDDITTIKSESYTSMRMDFLDAD